MSEVDVLPELKQIIGAMLFVAKQPLKASEIKKVLVQVAEIRGGATNRITCGLVIEPQHRH